MQAAGGVSPRIGYCIMSSPARSESPRWAIAFRRLFGALSARQGVPRQKLARAAIQYPTARAFSTYPDLEVVGVPRVSAVGLQNLTAKTRRAARTANICFHETMSVLSVPPSDMLACRSCLLIRCFCA
jgi:hypothetical protein